MNIALTSANKHYYSARELLFNATILLDNSRILFVNSSRILLVILLENLLYLHVFYATFYWDNTRLATISAILFGNLFQCFAELFREESRIFLRILVNFFCKLFEIILG